MTRRLAVALLIARFSTRGGNERVAAEVARRLTSRGHDVEVYCQKIDPSAHEVLPGPKVHRLPGPSFDPTLSMLSFAWSSARVVSRLRARRAVDVVLGFNHSVEQDVYRLGGGTHAEYLALTRGQARPAPVLDRAALALERRRLARPHTTWIAPSLRVSSELQRHYAIDPARIVVLANGVDLTRFHPGSGSDPEERARVRRGWGIALEEPVALFVGHDLERKGLPHAVAAAGVAGCRLVVVSRSPRPRALPPSVVWAGERSDVEVCYRAADVLVLPSAYDPFGGVVLEALASGLPAVATRRIGATERCAGTPLDALLVEDPADVPGLAAGLARALAPGRRAELQGAARAVAAGASLEGWAEALEHVLTMAADARVERER